MSREENRFMERYAYCLCLHVRPGTVFIGVVNMAGALLCSIIFMGELWFQHSKSNPSGIPDHGRTTAAALGVVVYLMCATVSGMLLFGVVKSRPSYLMPFFWIQLCDFFFSLPSFLSSLYASPGSPYVNHYQQSHTPPGGIVGKFWPHSSSAGAPTSTLLISTCMILFKGYFLCVVWKCYRYLKMKEMVLPLHFPSASHPSDLILPPGFVPPSVVPVAITSMAPPDYETATKSQPAPPDYDTAIRNNKEPDLKATSDVVDIGSNVTPTESVVQSGVDSGVNVASRDSNPHDSGDSTSTHPQQSSHR